MGAGLSQACCESPMAEGTLWKGSVWSIKGPTPACVEGIGGHMASRHWLMAAILDPPLDHALP